MQESSLAKIPEVDVKLELYDPPSHEEIKIATVQLKVGKSPGINGIPAEVYQRWGEAVLDKLKDLFKTVLRKGLYHRTSGMQPLSLCGKSKEENQTVQTIEASFCSPLQAKSWLASC